MKLRQNKLVPLILEDSDQCSSLASSQSARSAEYAELLIRLEVIRQRWIDDYEIDSSQPVDSMDYSRVCLRLPEELLKEYSERRSESRLGAVFAAANRLQSLTDRVILLGGPDSLRIARTFMEACCDPYWNELTRGERGSKPRLYFAGETLDNDLTQGLLQLVSSSRPANRHESLGWGLVILNSGERSQASRIIEAHLVQQLQDSGNGTLQMDWFPMLRFGEVTSSDIPSVLLPFSSLGMLPAAILGINIMELLAGAASTSRLFRDCAAGENPILRWVAWNRLNSYPAIASWNGGLHAASEWLWHLGRFPGLESNGADSLWRLLSPLSGGLSGNSVQACNHLRVENTRFDALASDPTPMDSIAWDPNSERPKRIGERSCDSKTLFDYLNEMYLQTVQKQLQQGTTSVTLKMPDLGELSLGQWMQWMIIATVLELELEQGI